MIQEGIEAIIIKVAAQGLTTKHLGMTLKEVWFFKLTLVQSNFQARESLIEANKKFQLNVCGEGGEYESFVLDSPLHECRISVDLCEAVLHSDNGVVSDPPVAYLRLSKVTLVSKQREESCSSSSSECKAPNQKIEQNGSHDKEAVLT